MKRFLIAAAATVALMTSASATTVGVSMAKFDDNFLTSVRNAIAKQAKAQNITVQFEDANNDVGKQLSQMQNFIAQKVDAIIVNPVDTSATPKMTKVAVDGGVPLVYVNRMPEDKTLPEKVAFVGSDDKVAGTLEGEELAKRLNGKGNVVIMQGELSNNAALQRTASAEEVLKKYPDIKVIQKQTANWQRNEAIDLMNNWLTSGQKIDGVVANNDEMAIGAILALQQAGQDPKSLAIGGVDATADGLSEMGKGNLAVTVFQNAAGQGMGAVDAAMRLVRGEKVDSMIWVPFEKVTKDNYKQYMNNN